MDKDTRTKAEATNNYYWQHRELISVKNRARYQREHGSHPDRLVHHHVKYKDIHGIEEVVLMSWSNTIGFAEVMLPNVVLKENIFYNTVTNTVYVISYFNAVHNKQIYYIDIQREGI